MRSHAYPLKPGLRNTIIPPRSLRPTDLSCCPASILRHHVGRHQRLVFPERHHLQPGTPTPEEGNRHLEMLAPLLHAVQNRPLHHQRRQLLLVPVQVRPVLRHETSQGYRG